jgi:hypothetical protein
MRRPLLALPLLLIATVGCRETHVAPHIAAITSDALSADLRHLSDDAFGGRLVGTPEMTRAADWIAERFRSMGLEPAGTDGFFEPFDLQWFSLGEGNSLTIGAGPARARTVGDEWHPMSISATGSAEGPVVFAGYGIVEPRVGHDDYKDADLSGKVVLVLEREPGVADPASPFDGLVTSEASRDWRKVLSAQERGAVAVLFVRDLHSAGEESTDYRPNAANYWPKERRRIESFTLGLWMDRVQVPVAKISVALAEQLVVGTGRTLGQLGTEAEAGTGMGVIELPDVTVSLNTAVTRNVTPARNILAMVAGSDPELSDEVVIIGAHHDHNGADSTGVFNGADDDGSGTVGVINAAAAYAAAAEEGIRPRRTVVFAIWDAEERGLLGAWYHTERPRYPLAQTAAVLNLDMIGRNEEVPEDGGARFRGLAVQTAESNANAINILGYSRTPGLAAAVDSANAEHGLMLRFRYDNNESNLLRRSDHWPFLQGGVPAVWFHTGLHPDYHTTADDADRINYEKMTRIVRLVHQVSWDLANADARPTLEGMGSRPAS